MSQSLTSAFDQTERYTRLLEQGVNFSMPVLAQDTDKAFWATPIIGQAISRLNDDDLLAVLTHRVAYLRDAAAAKVLGGLYADKIVSIANGAACLYFDDDFTLYTGRDEAKKWQGVAELLENDAAADLPPAVAEPAPLRA